MSDAAAQNPIQRALRAVHRERFLPPDQQRYAREDAPLPIGFEQTISQPSLVAYMTEQLAPEAGSRVLEIGTGSGYQTAILAEIAAEIFTVERIPELADLAHERLTALGYRNIRFRTGDGALGWPEDAPFDRILVTAGARQVPPDLVAQLGAEGKMLLPVGPTIDDQTLRLIEKNATGDVRQRDLCEVRFVPLVSATQH